MCSSDQFIHNILYDVTSKISHNLTVIYAHNQLANRKKSLGWHQKCAYNIKGPFIVIEDFYNVLTTVVMMEAFS